MTPLARVLGQSNADESQLRAMRAAVWHKQAIACFRLDEIRDDWTRQIIINAANKLYGQRQENATR